MNTWAVFELMPVYLFWIDSLNRLDELHSLGANSKCFFFDTLVVANHMIGSQNRGGRISSSWLKFFRTFLDPFLMMSIGTARHGSLGTTMTLQSRLKFLEDIRKD